MIYRDIGTSCVDVLPLTVQWPGVGKFDAKARVLVRRSCVLERVERGARAARGCMKVSGEVRSAATDRRPLCSRLLISG